MGIKYQPTVKDNKLGKRFQTQAQREASPTPNPGVRTAKKLSKKAGAQLLAKKKAAARLAAKKTDSDQSE